MSGVCAIPILGSLVAGVLGAGCTKQENATSASVTNKIATSLLSSLSVQTVANTYMTISAIQNLNVTYNNCNGGDLNINQNMNANIRVVSTTFASVTQQQVNDMKVDISNNLTQQISQATNALAGLLGTGALPSKTNVVLETAIASSVSQVVTVSAVNNMLANCTVGQNGNVTVNCFGLPAPTSSINQDMVLTYGLSTLASNVVTNIQANAQVVQLANEIAQDISVEQEGCASIFLIVAIVACVAGGLYFMTKSGGFGGGGFGGGGGGGGGGRGGGGGGVSLTLNS